MSLLSAKVIVLAPHGYPYCLLKTILKYNYSLRESYQSPYVYFSLSLSLSQVLCAWDIKEHTLIQSITVTFPFHGPQPSYGLKPLFLLTPSILTVSCNNHIVEYHLGTLSSFTTKWSVLSHAQPLTAAVYDSRYDQV